MPHTAPTTANTALKPKHSRKIVAHGSTGNGPDWFEVHTRNGQTLEFGHTPDSKLLAVGTPTVRVWALNKATDTRGNYLTVTYTQDAAHGQIYPLRIAYSGNTNGAAPYNKIEFSYTARADTTPSYQAGSLQQTMQHLSEIKTYQNNTLVLDYKIAYREGTPTVRSRVTSVTLCDHTTTTCLPSTTFGWQGGTGTLTPAAITPTNVPGCGSSTCDRFIGDYNGDGLTDMVAACPGSPSYWFSIMLGTQTPGTYTCSFFPLSAPNGDGI